MSKVQHNGIYYDPHNEIVCDKLRLKEIIEENEQLKKQLQEIKNVKSKELAEYLYASIPKFIVNEKVKLLERVKEEFDCCYSGDTYSPYQIADKIDEIIAELTHQHEDKGE